MAIEELDGYPSFDLHRPEDRIPGSWVTGPAFSLYDLCFEWKITRTAFLALPKGERAEMIRYFRYTKLMAAFEAQEMRKRDEIARQTSGRR